MPISVSVEALNQAEFQTPALPQPISSELSAHSRLRLQRRSIGIQTPSEAQRNWSERQPK